MVAWFNIFLIWLPIWIIVIILILVAVCPQKKDAQQQTFSLFFEHGCDDQDETNYKL